MPEEMFELKRRLRKECRMIRSALSETYRQDASRRICSHIAGWPVFQESKIVLAYLPMRAEVDLTPLMEDNPHKTWLVPRIGDGSHMFFHEYDPKCLVMHPYGMLEPDPSLPSIPAGQVELALTPGLAYDQVGWRLGYGGGFYDRFLEQHRTCISLGVTFQALIMSDLPHMAHDIPVQFLVTEDGVKSVLLFSTG